MQALMRTIRHRFVPVVITALLLALPGAAFSDQAPYAPITPPQPTSSAQNKIEVVEVFWYGCPHCYRLEPYVNRWLKTKPANVEFVRMPGIFRPTWEIHARAFYTAEALGVLDKIHTPLFEAIHELNQPMQNEIALMNFFAEHGVSNDDFKKVFNSFAVNTKVQRAAEMSDRYGIEGVPSLIVNGKYRTSPSQAGSQAKVFNVVDELIAKEAKGG